MFLLVAAGFLTLFLLIIPYVWVVNTALAIKLAIAWVLLLIIVPYLGLITRVILNLIAFYFFVRVPIWIVSALPDLLWFIPLGKWWMPVKFTIGYFLYCAEIGIWMSSWKWLKKKFNLQDFDFGEDPSSSSTNNQQRQRGILVAPSFFALVFQLSLRPLTPRDHHDFHP